MKLKILLDMNISPVWVDYLKQNNFDAIHWSDIGKGNAPDVEIFEYAKKNDYVLFTHDLDFSTMLANTKSAKPSVIQIRTQNIIPEIWGNIFFSILKENHSLIEKGAILIIEEYSHRIRILPLS
jgi:predicted nuclease of predicted toxin-antitoxin system